MTMNTEKFQRVHVALDSVSISTMQYLSEISIKVIQPQKLLLSQTEYTNKYCILGW